MKRSYSCNTSDEKVKRQKFRLNILTIPNDIQNLIFSKLQKKDIISLSSINKEHREELISTVFKNIKGTWHSLVNDKLILSKYSYNIIQLRITDCDSYSEWQVDFNSFLRKLPNIKHLLINSGNSSNWLKYRSNCQINELSLFFENLEQPTVNNVISSRSPRIFSIEHVNKLENLKRLNLDSYHFNWEPKDNFKVAHIESLTLNNCTWEYPFKLSQFNYSGTIKKMVITYSKKNAFILSERFNQFLIGSEVFENVEDLEILLFNNDSITLNEYRFWEKYLYWANFSKFFDRIMFPLLKRLKLHGWDLNLENLRIFLRKINREQNRLQELDMRIVSQKSIKLPIVISECNELFPLMKFKLKIDEP